ncbi:MAG TPA: cobyrinic acid a,c-diamide synthase [Mycobacteriales bacterium]|nr:cobyrinic acid a,c-diamide synthase [Mycobacteriales bacterium]
MTRRISLPGADELFRATGSGSPEPPGDSLAEPPAHPVAPADPSGRGGAAPVRHLPRRVRDDRRPTGRERHEEKITVYCSPEELIDLEHARLTLRGDHGLAVDRGRIVREAMAVVLADLDAKGEASILVRRLRGQ